MPTTDSRVDKPATGKNISVYLNKDLLAMVESSGRPASQLVQEALRRYFMDANREEAARRVAETARLLGESKGFAEAVSEWRRDREADRW